MPQERKIKNEQIYLLQDLLKMRKNLIKNSSLKRVLKGIYLPEKNWKIIDRRAHKLERSTNWLLSKIIDNWIVRNHKK